MDQKPILPPEIAKDPTINRSPESLIEAAARVDEAEKRTERAEVRTGEARVRTEQAEVRTQQAEVRLDQAETRIEQAETRIGEAEARTEQAKARTEEAKARTEQAETRTERAETRSEQAETRGEQAIVHSELKYRRLFEAARDGILILDRDTGRIDDVNPFLTELLGFSHAEMVGRTVGELSPSKDREWKKVLSRLQAQGYARCEDLFLETKDGRQAAVDLVSNVYEADGHKVIQCNIRDVAQRKRVEMTFARLAAIVECSDDAIIGKDLNSVVTSWNPGAEKIFGYTAGEMVGTSIRRLIPDDRQDAEEKGILRRVRSGEPVEHFETRRRSKDGRNVDVSIAASPVRGDTGDVIGVSIIARDITARRKAEKKLSESQASMAAAQRIAHIGSWELDLTGHPEVDTHSLRWSDEMFRIAGYEPAAVAVTKEFCYSIIPEVEHAPIREAVRAGMGGRERFSIVHQLIRPDGEARIVLEEGQIFFRAETGQPEKIIGTAHDITDQRKAEDVLRESERRLREMLESVELVAITLDNDGKVTFCNDYFLRLAGWKREEVLGMDWCSNFLPAEAVAAKAAFFDHIATGAIPGHYENPIKTRTGEIREIAWNNTSLRDSTGNIVGAASLGEDVTERNLAAARHLEQEEANRANRAKSEFLSRMSHELRTPLHAILGFAQLLEMDGQSTEDAESVGQIVRAGKHLLGLINEVLDLAAVEAGKLEVPVEPVQVREALEAVLSLVKPLAAARRVRLEPLAGDLDCEVLFNERRFTQVILNLLSNAVKFNREDGTVSVSGEQIEDRLCIKVADTGRGISPENMAKLFVPFERLEGIDTVTEGSGLGLALSKHLIESMGGSISVESVVGKGSTFWVEMPLVQGTATAPERAFPPNVAMAPRCAAAGTLLYIEDNLSNLRLVERILARRPEVKLISAMQGALGLKLARQHQPDLILLDLHLPDIQGDNILRQLRADPVTAGIPVVMISADATTAQIERLRAAGADEYLTKPIDVRAFLAVVDATAHRPRE